MSLDTDLGVAIRAVERERGSYAPEYNMSRLLGASGESITRARKRYIYLTGVIERLQAHREDLKSEKAKK